MSVVADSQELRESLDRFVASYVVEDDAIVSARVLKDAEGEFLAIAVESGFEGNLPDEFDGLRVVVSVRAAGHVAAGPLR
jgi:hypothetical protein